MSKQVCCVCGEDWALGHRCKPSKTRAERIAERVVQGVCELPDYNSPEGQPDLVMCTVQELHNCVLQAFEQLKYDTEMAHGPSGPPPSETNALATFVRARFDAGDIKLSPDQFDELHRLLGPRHALKASETPEQRRAATDAAALADAHRMYEAEHGEPFSENGNPR